jgi:hypothetical protein
LVGSSSNRTPLPSRSSPIASCASTRAKCALLFASRQRGDGPVGKIVEFELGRHLRDQRFDLRPAPLIDAHAHDVADGERFIC